MDSKNDLLKTSWSTLLAVFIIMAMLALTTQASAAVDVEYAPIASVTP